MKISSYKLLKLPNGLVLVLQPLMYMSSVTVSIAVGAGSRYETQETSGIAHFLEHMLFEGTKNLPSSKEVAKYIEKIGGRSGAWTDKEYVNYSAKVPSRYLDTAFSYLSEILFNSTLKDRSIEREKNIVMEEFKRSQDNPEVDIWDLWFEWAWGENQPLGRSILGSNTTIKNITRKQLQTYMNNLYHPANMVIAVVGSFFVKEAKEYVLKYFGKNQSRDIPKFTKAISAPKKTLMKVINKNSHQAQLMLGYITDVSYAHKDRFVMRVIADILGTGVSSRLFHRFVYELGISYVAGTQLWIFADTGLFFAHGGFSKDNIKKAVEVILEEIDRLRKERVSDQELSEAKEKDKAQLYFSLETSDAMANFYASQQITEKRILTPEEISNRIDEVTAEDVQKVAMKYFNIANLRLTISGSLTEKDKISIENLLTH